MTRKVYRTAQGRMIDLGALQLQNEHVRAVGNMGVNARGDLVDADNRTVRSRNDEVKRQYHRQLSNNVSHDEVATPGKTKRTATSVKPKESKAKKIDIPPPPEDFDDNFEKPVTAAPAASTVESTTSGTSGLAAAIARAREVKQEPLKHPREQTGIKRI